MGAELYRPPDRIYRNATGSPYRRRPKGGLVWLSSIGELPLLCFLEERSSQSAKRLRTRRIHMRGLLLLAASLIAMAGAVCTAKPALAESRVALLVANSAYQGAPPLTTPETDKALIAQTLEAAGYDVTQ